VVRAVLPSSTDVYCTHAETAVNSCFQRVDLSQDLTRFTNQHHRLLLGEARTRTSLTSPAL